MSGVLGSIGAISGSEYDNETISTESKPSLS